MATPTTLIDDPIAPDVQILTDALAPGATTPVVIDDEENILQAHRAGVSLDAVYVVGEQSVPEAVAALGVDCFQLTPSVARTVFGKDKRPRLFALSATFTPPTLEHIAARGGDVVVLDGVRLAGNIGAITRTAAALGAAGVVVVGSGLNSVTDRRLIRASRGTVFSVPVVLAKAEETAAFLTQLDTPLVSLDIRATEPIDKLKDWPGRVALLLGSERTGASASMSEQAEHTYFIPMSDAVESLNVSVTAGIALYAHASAGNHYC